MTWRNASFLSALHCPVLVVGAGGIGCEVLKDLALTGFSNIEIIDLDIISVSNLNRQFLFRREHVGKPKAVVAAEAVRLIAPGVQITCHYDSVLNEKYDVEFFQKFKVVLGALDNIAARNHVNRLCLAARVPLIESGSSGYFGHVRPIIRDLSECYECIPKPAQRTYPGCTIRNTPSEPIHCIVWAKHLFNQLFGEADAEDEVSPDFTDAENTESNRSGADNMDNEGKPTEYTNGSCIDQDSRISVRQWAVSNGYDPRILFKKFFHDDIEYLLRMSNLWRQRTKPFPLDWNNISDEIPCSSQHEPNMELWTPLECRNEFEEAVISLRDLVKDGTNLVWDKDNDQAVRFVAAAANLRAHIFCIPLKTLFDIKSMAGNIIPAIATTNAIVAGLIVAQALKVVSGENTLRNIYISPKPNPYGKVLVDEPLSKPNPECCVCADRREISLKTNVKITTVRSLENKFLKGMLHMVAPDVIVANGGKIIISSEEGEVEAASDQPLAKLGVLNGTLLDCDDFQQNFEIRVRIYHCEALKIDQFEFSNDSDSIVRKEYTSENSDGARKRSFDDLTLGAPQPKVIRNGDEVCTPGS